MKRRLAIDSAIISGLTGLGVLAGLGTDVLIALRYGVGGTTDAYFVAVTLPVLILAAALSSGQTVLVVALTPPSPGEAGGDGRAEAREALALFSALFTLALFLGLALALAGSLASPWLMRLLAPGLDDAALSVAVGLSRVLFWEVPAFLALEVVRARLYAHAHFAAAAAANFLPSLLTLLLLLLAPSRQPLWIAWSLLAGSWAGLLWLWLALHRFHLGGYQPRLGWHDPEVRRVGRELGAPMASILLRQSIVLAERGFASFLPPGSVTALAYGGKITRVLAGTVLNGAATAGLPALATALAGGLRARVAYHWRRLLSLNTAAAVPLGLAMVGGGYLLARYGHTLLGGLSATRGILEEGGAARLGAVFAAYGLSLFLLGPFRAQQSYLYAARLPRQVGLLFLLSTAITLALDWPLMRWWGAAGLALSFSAGILAAFALGVAFVRGHLRTLSLASVAGSLD